MDNPRLFGEWSYLSIEPIIGSGEYINVGIVLFDEEGVHYEPILDIEKSIFLFGKNGEKLFSIIANAQSQLLDLDYVLESVSNIQFSLSGVHVSDKHVSCYENRDEFLRELKKNSMFGSIGFELSVERYLKATTRERPLEHFIENVKTELIGFSNNYGNYFNIWYHVPVIKNNIKYGFATKDYVSNFSYISPVPYLRGMIKNSIYKIAELSLLKASKLDTKPKQYELILYLPEDVPLDKRMSRRLGEENEKLQAFADESEVNIFRTRTVKATAGYLLDKIVA